MHDDTVTHISSPSITRLLSLTRYHCNAKDLIASTYWIIPTSLLDVLYELGAYPLSSTAGVLMNDDCQLEAQCLL